jgi:hypothetical protein
MDYLLVTTQVGAMGDLVLTCVTCSAVTGKLALAQKPYALGIEKRMHDIILTQRENSENPEGAVWKPQATQRRCQVHILEA